MTIPQLFVPNDGTPIFAAGARVLVAGYSSIGGSWNPTLCGAGAFREPWLPQQTPIFDLNRSTIDSIPRLPDDVIRVTTISTGTSYAYSVAAIIRAANKKDEYGMRMYVLSEDTGRKGDALLKFLETHRGNPLLSMARFGHQFALLTQQINETVTEVRRELRIRCPGFMH